MRRATSPFDLTRSPDITWGEVPPCAFGNVRAAAEDTQNGNIREYVRAVDRLVSLLQAEAATGCLETLDLCSRTFADA